LDVCFRLMAGIVVKPRARILHGHDWVFSSEVLKVFGKPQDGDVISLRDGRDHLIGSAIYNSKSQIVARRFSRRKQDLDLDFFIRRIAQAAEYRDRRGVDSKLRRVVWSESDGLPGVIIDRYRDNFILQTLTLAMDMRKELIANAIERVFCRATAPLAGATSAAGGPPSFHYDATGAPALQSLCIIERNDAPVRKAEGLEPRTGILRGESDGTITLEIAGLKFELDLLHGQKTGFYLDQKQNYEIVASFAKERRVLDCFTNQGGFALACAKAGASEVTAVEENSENISAAMRNAQLNNQSVDWVEQDVFQFLRGAEKAEKQFDLIILDPPSFTKAKAGLRDALRGYRELHLRAFKLLSKDGLLATFSCSHHVKEAAFAQTIADALVDARRSARQLRRFEQPLDHPILPTLPETEYFKGFLLEMMPGR
jgi:23S rRNA (cytosine1962-C5)-methyltransferase